MPNSGIFKNEGNVDPDSPIISNLPMLRRPKPNTLDLSRRKIDDGNVLTVLQNEFKIFKQQGYDPIKKITRLDLSYNRINDQGVIFLCHFLPIHLPTIKMLSLAHNIFGDDATKSLQQFIQKYPLDELKLSHNFITCNGAGILAKALMNSQTSLNSLKLKSNQIGVAGARKIAYALLTNKALCHLDLDGNHSLNLDMESGVIFRNALESNRTLTTLKLYWSDICENELSRNRVVMANDRSINSSCLSVTKFNSGPVQHKPKKESTNHSHIMNKENVTLKSIESDHSLNVEDLTSAFERHLITPPKPYETSTHQIALMTL